MEFGISGSSPPSGRVTALCVAGSGCVFPAEELTWSATSSAWLIRSPCPISPSAVKALQRGQTAPTSASSADETPALAVAKMLRCCLLRPTILCAERAQRPLRTHVAKHATWTVRSTVTHLNKWE